MSREFPWAPGSATGIGSLPGTDIAEAVKTVFGELPELPYLPELPARGPGADMIGRAAGLLVDMPVELYAGVWRIASHPGRDAGRTADLWARDLDTLTDHAADFDGPVKVQVAGVWTLAASVDLPVGGRLLRDAGAVRDLAASLAEGVAAYVREVAARLPRARVLLQIDEPSLPVVLAGRVPTESGFSVLPAVEVSTATTALAQVVSAAGVPVIVHCCAPEAPLGLFRDAGAAAVGIDLDLLPVTALDPLGEALEAGLGLFAGAVRTTGGGPGPGGAEEGADVAGSDRDGGPGSGYRAGTGSDRAGADVDGEPGPPPGASAAAERRIRDLWRTIGFSANDLAAQVVVTPACGLAGLSPTAARALTSTCREAARRLADS